MHLPVTMHYTFADITLRQKQNLGFKCRDTKPISLALNILIPSHGAERAAFSLRPCPFQPKEHVPYLMSQEQTRMSSSTQNSQCFYSLWNDEQKEDVISQATYQYSSSITEVKVFLSKENEVEFFYKLMKI
jgi:hypothetical protein